MFIYIYSFLAQLVEHAAVNRRVVGSSPTEGATVFSCAVWSVVLKNIVFLSNNKKKSLLYEFCVAYKSILSKHSLFATFEDSVSLKNLGLSFTPLLSASVGGYRQVISKLQCGEFDLVFFFRGTYCFEKDSSIDFEILKACDYHNIPIATNLLTAEILLRSLSLEIF